MGKNKLVTAEEAIALIRNGDTLSCSGFVGIGTPEALIAALERRFVDTGGPVELTLVFAAAPGDGKALGLNRLAHVGLIKRAIGGHWALLPKLAALAVADRIEAYNLPLGIISHLYRDAAGGRPGTLTKIGLGTFVDPRQEVGRINPRTTEDLVRVMTIDGQEWLFYKAFRLDVAFIRGTTADLDGNITMEREALVLDVQAAAMAARNANGLVIAQVERIAPCGSLNARDVVVPGVLVDYLVLAPPAAHRQTYATDYNPAYSGGIPMPDHQMAALPLDERKVIARRCAFELPLGGVINLGIGMPEVVAAVAAEEQVLDYVTLTTEPGVIGGIPQGGLDFGAAVNTQALLHQNQQFDFYDGGGLDLACLGMAEIDGVGNVNVSRFGPRLAGAGGFINISQSARHLVFAGTFTTGGLQVVIEDGRVRIAREGTTRKFVKAVEQITFNGALAFAKGQSVHYVTERCVFALCSGGLQLIEVAPGIDIASDIVAQMGFEPMIGTVRIMDPCLYRTGAMDLSAVLLEVQLADRLTVDIERKILFVNLEGLTIQSVPEIQSVRRVLDDVCSKAGDRVALIANYEGVRIDKAVKDAYFSMIREMQAKHFSRATRYTTCAVLRGQLEQALGSSQSTVDDCGNYRVALQSLSRKANPGPGV